MNIIIIGAGEVGSHIAELLCEYSQSNVAVIEKDKARCKRLDKNEKLDVRVVRGNGAHPETLEKAGLSEADLLVAVTQSDAVNLTACMLGKMFGPENQKRVVRIEAAQLDQESNPRAAQLIEEVGADLVVDPDRAVAKAIEARLEFGYPGIAEYASMGDGAVVMLGAQVREESDLVGSKLSEIGAKYGDHWPYMIGAISHNGTTDIPRSDAVIEKGDIVRVVCLADKTKLFIDDLGIEDFKFKRVLIIGGGRTGEILASSLSRKGYKVRLVEQDKDRAAELSELLPKSVKVFEGDATDNDFLDSISIDRQDVVLALTGDDDTNILACLYAQNTGVKEYITQLHRLNLKRVAETLDIDVAPSPRTSCADEVLRFVLSPDDQPNGPNGAGQTDEHAAGVQQVATFLTMDVELLEFTVEPNSPAAGKAMKDVGFKGEHLVGAVVRRVEGEENPQVSIPRRNFVLEEDDHLVVFTKHEHAEEARGYFKAC